MIRPAILITFVIAALFVYCNRPEAQADTGPQAGGGSVARTGEREEAPRALNTDELIDVEREFRYAREVFGRGVPDVEPEPYLLHRVGSVKTAEYLVAQGVEVNSLDLNGMTPLGCALMRGNDELVEFLLLVGGKAGGGIFDAVAAGDVQALQKELKTGVKVNEPGPGGFSALHYAAAAADPDIVSRLLKAGADPLFEMTGKDVPEAYGSRLTPLNAAISNGRAAAVKALLDAGALPDWVKSERGMAPNAGGDDPLVLAVNFNEPIIVGMLLEAGAHPATLDWGFGEGVPLASMAVEHGWLDSARLLFEHGAKPLGPELVEVAGKGDREFVELLLKKGVDVNVCDYHGRTPLAAALSGHNWELAKMLLDKGGEFGNTFEPPDQVASYDRLLFEAHLQGVDWAKGLLEERGSWMSKPLLEEAMRMALWQGDEERIKRLEGMGASRTPPAPDPRFGYTGTLNIIPTSKESRAKIVAEAPSSSKRDARSLLNDYDMAYRRPVKDGLASFQYELGLVDPDTGEPAEALALAVLLNDHQRVERLMKDGADPEAAVGRDMTPLLLATLHARASTLELMLKLGANPDAPAPQGDRSWGSLLLVAIEQGLYEKARVLIDFGADYERSVILRGHEVPGAALHHAARMGDKRLIDYLFLKGADVDSTSGGFTPLFMAAKWGKREAVERLIAYGADVNIECANGWTALDAAVDCWTMETVWPLREAQAELSGRREIGEQACYNHEQAVQRKRTRQAEAFVASGATGEGYEALRSAIEKDNDELALKLIESGVDFAARGPQSGSSVAQLAVIRGRTEVVREMLERGLDPNKVGPSGRSLMEAAWMMPEPEMLQLLLDAGGYIHSPKSLHTLAAKGDIEGLKAEVALGRSLRQQDPNRQTPLQYAILMGHLEAVRVLRDAQAKQLPIRQPVRERQDPLVTAARAGNPDVLELLLSDVTPEMLNEETYRNGESPLATAAKYGNLEAAKLLIEAGAPVDQDTENSGVANNKPPLFYAAMEGHQEMVRLLVEKGATIDFGTGEGSDRSPLQVAIQEGQEDTALLLIDLGADPKRELDRDSSVLHEAAEYGLDRLVTMLIDKGADVNLTRGWSGHTPLDWAVMRDHWRTAAILRSRGGKTEIELKLEGRPRAPNQP